LEFELEIFKMTKKTKIRSFYNYKIDETVKTELQTTALYHFWIFVLSVTNHWAIEAKVAQVESYYKIKTRSSQPKKTS
jgi:hypothetical protein